MSKPSRKELQKRIAQLEWAADREDARRRGSQAEFMHQLREYAHGDAHLVLRNGAIIPVVLVDYKIQYQVEYGPVDLTIVAKPQLPV